MADPAIVKVENALAAALSAYSPLSGVNIKILESADVALEEADIPAIVIYTVAYRFTVAEEGWQTLHTATIEFEAVSGAQAVGTISRANHEIIANVLGAIGQDRTLGGMLQDVQETDVAPSTPNGKDLGAASLQCEVLFYTRRDDWFTIMGQLGAQF